LENFVLENLGKILVSTLGTIIIGLIVYIFKQNSNEIERVKLKNEEIETNYIDRFDKVNASIRQQTEVLTHQINDIKDGFVRKSEFNQVIDRISNYIDKNSLLVADSLDSFGKRIEKRLDKHEEKIEELQQNKRG
jgi:uncharacterized protein YPO0396